MEEIVNYQQHFINFIFKFGKSNDLTKFNCEAMLEKIIEVHLFESKYILS